MRNERQDTEATPRALPAVCAAATLAGAVLWSEAAIAVGLAVVGLWAPLARMLGHAANGVGAAAFGDKVPSAARAAPK